MPSLVIADVVGVLFLASIFRTTFGFGEALVAVPLLALAIPIQVATPVAVLASIVIASFVVAKDWRHIHFQSARRLIFSTLFGLPIGLLLLKTVPEPIVKIVLAFILIIFSSYSLLTKNGLTLSSDRWAWIFGWLAGVSGGAYGMNGPPLAIYGALRGWTPERFRATLQAYFLPASILGMLGYAVTGIWTMQVNVLFLWSLPAVVLGIFVGRKLNRCVGPQRFSRLLHFGLIFIALILLLQVKDLFHN